MTATGKRGGPPRGPRPRIAVLLAVLSLALAAAPGRAQDAPTLGGGRNVNLSATNMDLATFLELLSKGYKLNIVSPKDIAGRVSVNFHEVPPLDALKAVLEANGYRYVVEETAAKPIIKIQPIPKLEGVVPVEMQTFVLKYATAGEVAKVVGALLTKSGSATVAEGRNAVVVQDIADNMTRIQDVVKMMDFKPRQVLIDAKIIELGRTDLQERGFNWSMFQNMNIAVLQAVGESTAENIADITAEASYARDATTTKRTLTGTPTTLTHDITRAHATKVNLRGGILEENAAQLFLDFFDTLTSTQIISRPSVRTLDNKSAHIISGQVVPIPLFDFAKDTGVRTLSGFQEEQIGVELTVTPHINDDGYITLEINPKVESIERYIAVAGDEQRPVKNTRQSKTTVRVRDGNTAVIGGLTAATTTVTETGLPWFKELPLFGKLFRNKTSNVVTTELIIFVSARIVDDEGEPLSDEEIKLLRKFYAV